ncbi:MAG: chitobiase/beta-hexosaminidase C-terminal domain-containing protein [Steroidobacteraceae bacterium]
MLTGCGGKTLVGGTGTTAGVNAGDSTPTAETPAFTPGPGAYSSSLSVAISSATSGATINYTTDGSTPTTSSAVYSGVIPVSATKTVRAIATASGYQPSNVASAAYTISSGALMTPANLQVINQGGPNNGKYDFYDFLGAQNCVASDANANYQGLSWLAATPGSNPISKYNIYRNGSLYDSISTPISITGYISTPTLSGVTITGTSGEFSCNSTSLYAGQLITISGTHSGSGSISGYANPTTYQVQATNGSTTFTLGWYDAPAMVTTAGSTTGLTFTSNPLLTVTAVSGGTTSIADGKILPGLKLTSSASGFVAGTVIVEYITATSGGGGTGTYSVSYPQTCGSSNSPVTFTGWSYNDTESTNCNVYNWASVSTVYAYSVTAVDTQNNEGPHANPNAYMFQGVSQTENSNFSYAGVGQNFADTAGSPVNGPYDIAVTLPSGGGGFQPVWCGGGPDSNGCLCPVQHFECGAFNYLTFDIKVTDDTFETHPIQYVPIMRAYGVAGGADGNHWSVLYINNYCTPIVGQWVTCKIPFSALCYGFINCTGSFAATAQYYGNLTITSFGTQTAFAIDGSGYITGPGIPEGSYISDYPSTEPPSGSGPWVYNVTSPNIVGTETGSGSYVYQGTNCYKHSWGYGVVVPDNTGTFYLNNIGFTTD